MIVVAFGSAQQVLHILPQDTAIALGICSFHSTFPLPAWSCPLHLSVTPQQMLWDSIWVQRVALETRLLPKPLGIWKPLHSLLSLCWLSVGELQIWTLKINQPVLTSELIQSNSSEGRGTTVALPITTESKSSSDFTSWIVEWPEIEVSGQAWDSGFQDSL